MFWHWDYPEVEGTRLFVDMVQGAGEERISPCIALNAATLSLMVPDSAIIAENN